MEETKDHEARSHQYDEEEENSTPDEYTPLISSRPSRRMQNITKLLVVLMISFMLFGIVVSVFLFVEQDREWPVNIPFEMVTRSGWNAKPGRYPYNNITDKPVKYVIITHTNSEPCIDTDECKKMLKNMQNYYQNTTTLNRTDLPFNFFISPAGMTFEGRGWDFCGEVDSSIDCKSFSVAAIGDYAANPPPLLIIKEFKAFLDEAIWRSKLSPNYVIVGRPFQKSPEILFKILRNWRHWSSE